MYNYEYGYPTTSAINNAALGSMVWAIVAAILAIVGGILVYCLFLQPKKDLKLNKFLSWLKDFLSFKVMMIESILKVLYLISTIYVILISFGFIGTSFVTFILMLILGPIVIRIAYEGILIILMIWKNTNEINKKTK